EPHAGTEVLGLGDRAGAAGVVVPGDHEPLAALVPVHLFDQELAAPDELDLLGYHRTRRPARHEALLRDPPAERVVAVAPQGSVRCAHAGEAVQWIPAVSPPPPRNRTGLLAGGQPALPVVGVLDRAGDGQRGSGVVAGTELGVRSCRASGGRIAGG